jgi:hypothetical protein
MYRRSRYKASNESGFPVRKLGTSLYRMDIYPPYPKRTALNAITPAFPIPVDNVRLRACLMMGGEAAALKRLDPVFASPCCGPRSMLRWLC